MFLKANPEKYPAIIADQLPDASTFSVNEEEAKNLSLTANYISAIAEYNDLEYAESPTLQVVEAFMDYEETSNSSNKKTNSIHFTHLRLCDGSRDVMKGHLSMHLAHDGKKLDPGDIIQLNSFTPLTYSPSGQDSTHRSPAVLIHTYSKVGYASLPKKLNPPRHCMELTAKQKEEYTINSMVSSAGPLEDGEDDICERLKDV